MSDSCRTCRHLVAAADALERQVPGLNILSSGNAATRADTAWCRRLDLFLVPGAACPAFAPEAPPAPSARGG